MEETLGTTTNPLTPPIGKPGDFVFCLGGRGNIPSREVLRLRGDGVFLVEGRVAVKSDLQLYETFKAWIKGATVWSGKPEGDGALARVNGEDLPLGVPAKFAEVGETRLVTGTVPGPGRGDGGDVRMTTPSLQITNIDGYKVADNGAFTEIANEGDPCGVRLNSAALYNFLRSGHEEGLASPAPAPQAPQRSIDADVLSRACHALRALGPAHPFGELAQELERCL